MLIHASRELDKYLKPTFSPFPKWNEKGWAELPEPCRVELVAQAEKTAEEEIPVLRASLYMEYVRNGNRSRYEKVYMSRRNCLSKLLLGECAEGKGRFIDRIIDYVWAICEETTWLLPAHNPLRYQDGTGSLGDFNERLPFIGLFSAETGSILSWTHYFLGEQLAKENPLIPLRIEQEITKRLLTPFLERSDMWWMGLDHSKQVNNWNPWILSNLLPAFLLIETDPTLRLAGLKKIARSAQRFLDFYEEDGGCDEGPSYFSVAGASMLDILEIFYDATDGALSIYDQPLIKNMADYIRHVHIAGNKFVNYADAPGQLSSISAGLLIRAGKLTDNPALSDFARSAYASGLAPLPWTRFDARLFFRTLKTLFTYTDSDLHPVECAPETGHYFSGIQVATGRTTNDMFFSAKGGHNNESHNHNDIGNYLIYAHGEPCVIDVGVGTYSKKTFSPQRYEIWAMQSGYHNTAIVNGCDQLPQEACAAHSVEFTDSEDSLVFSLNIGRAYDPAAQLNSYERRFELNREGNTLTVTDAVAMTECIRPVQLPVICYHPPKIGDGAVDLNGVTLTFDPALFTASFEELDLNDPENPIITWGKATLYRLLLTRTQQKTEDCWSIVYTLN